MSHEFGVSKTQRDEYERKLEEQLKETAAIQAALKQLEQNHTAYRSYYEAEILRLQREAAAKGVELVLRPPPTGAQLAELAAASQTSKRPREGDAAAASSADKMPRTQERQDWSYTSNTTKVDLMHTLRHSMDKS